MTKKLKWVDPMKKKVLEQNAFGLWNESEIYWNKWVKDLNWLTDKDAVSRVFELTLFTDWAVQVNSFENNTSINEVLWTAMWFVFKHSKESLDNIKDITSDTYEEEKNNRIAYAMMLVQATMYQMISTIFWKFNEQEVTWKLMSMKDELAEIENQISNSSDIQSVSNE